MKKSYSHENQHRYSLSHETLKCQESLDMAKDQVEVNVGKIHIHSTLRTPNSIMNFLVTNLEIVCHHSQRLPTPLYFWKVGDSQLRTLVFLNQQSSDRTTIQMLETQGVFYSSNLLLMHQGGSQYSGAPQLINFPQG